MKTKKKAVMTIVLSGDKNADWIKLVDGGKHQRADLAAHEAAQKLHDEREAAKKKGNP